jgi:hypothetical protein
MKTIAPCTTPMTERLKRSRRRRHSCRLLACRCTCYC